jgi:NitT/TauT family transport system substrate-binding protein
VIGTRRGRFLAGLCSAVAALPPRRSLAQTSLVPLRVAHVAVADAVPYEYAVQQGWFAQAGLDIKADLLASGSAAATAVVGGAVDIGSSNLFTAVQARAKGIPVVIVAPGGRYEEAVPTSQLLVAADSPIKTGKDLEGRTVAVAGLNDMSSLSVRAWVTLTGGDPAKIKYVETPMSTMLGMVQERHVDAIFVSEPALQTAEASGVTRRLAITYTAIAKHFFTSVWITTAPFIAQHRDLALKFADVLHRATLYTNAHYAEALPLISSYTKLPLETLRNMHQIKGGPTLVAEDIQPMIDVAAKYHAIPNAFPAKEMMLAGVP